MTDRDRLITKIMSLNKPTISLQTAMDIVDAVIDMGVIVPPCKVGDTVYFDNTWYHDSAEIDGIHIDENGIAFSWVQYDVGVDITELWDEGEFDIEEIGKTVFLTKEEAEAELRKRSNDNA